MVFEENLLGSVLHYLAKYSRKAIVFTLSSSLRLVLLETRGRTLKNASLSISLLPSLLIASKILVFIFWRKSVYPGSFTDDFARTS